MKGGECKKERAKEKHEGRIMYEGEREEEGEEMRVRKIKLSRRRKGKIRKGEEKGRKKGEISGKGRGKRREGGHV